MENFKITLKNKKVKRLVNINLLISFIISFCGIVTLWLYNGYYISKYLFDAGIVIFRTGLLMGTFAIMFGIFFENYLDCG